MIHQAFPPRVPWPPRATPPSTPEPVPVFKPTVPQPVSIRARFQIKLGVTVFGTPNYFNLDEALSEFQNFVQNNSKLDLQFTTNKYPPLALDEYHIIPDSPNCTFVDPWYVHSETLSKLPPNVAVQVFLYDVQNTKSCFGGRAYQPSPQTRNVPLIAIPFGETIRQWGIEPNWRTRTATALVHEFYHAISQILAPKGYNLPDPDKANQFGYTTENDPGWVRFDKFLYSQLTQGMYMVLSP